MMFKKFCSLFKCLLMVFSVLSMVSILTHILCFDYFQVRGDSMNPTLIDGDCIIVNKLYFGARIYTNYNFTNYRLESLRLPAIRGIAIGDIIVFNNIHPNKSSKIEFMINNVLVKRCIGLPGDTIGITDGFYYNLSFPNATLCPISFQSILSNLPDSIIILNNEIEYNAVKFTKEKVWTIKNYGPLFVPAENKSIFLNYDNIEIYDKIIEYETGCKPILNEKGLITLNGTQISSYTFKENYYFVVGDNMLNSRDSRYFGAIPESYIIGISNTILFSKMKYSNKINRILQKL